MKKIVFVLSMFLVLLTAVSALADTIPYQINDPNAALQNGGFLPPYAEVSITVNGPSNQATVTVNRDGTYLIGDGGSFDLSLKSPATAGSFSWTGGNATTAFSTGNPGNISEFGFFNLTIDDFDGFTRAVESLTFTLTKVSGTWASASDVLIANSDGYLIAAHIFPPGGIDTGFAGNGTPIPEPTTMLLLGSGLLGLAGFVRRRFKK